MILPIRACGLPRGIVRGLVGDVWLGEGVGWSSLVVRFSRNPFTQIWTMSPASVPS